MFVFGCSGVWLFVFICVQKVLVFNLCLAVCVLVCVYERGYRARPVFMSCLLRCVFICVYRLSLLVFKNCGVVFIVEFNCCGFVFMYPNPQFSSVFMCLCLLGVYCPESLNAVFMCSRRAYWPETCCESDTCIMLFLVLCLW